MSRYFSSPDTEIRLNGVTVSEAYSLEFQGQINIMPFNAWNKAKSEFADGTRLASGTLILNDINPTYIGKMMKGVASSVQDNRAVYKKNLEEKAQALAQTYLDNEVVPDVEALIRLGRSIKNLRDVEVTTEEIDDLEVGNSPFFTDEFDLSVLTVDGHIKRAVAKLEGCRFTGNTFLVQSASSQNLKRAYSFLAKDFSH